MERLEGSVTKRRLQLRTQKEDNTKVSLRSGRDKSPTVGLDKENDIIEIAKSSKHYAASHFGAATDRSSGWHEYSIPNLSIDARLVDLTVPIRAVMPVIGEKDKRGTGIREKMKSEDKSMK
ncbi:unnamed protein product [Haemonchus placei]|uniref:Reverse transcriptase domain-containing protein n=1 Tax=Haemonchus placei TaxID=6290 RepID=A0A0N4WPN6_HAEPC|nr:unnamed protein product [Haemonchus placei]